MKHIQFFLAAILGVALPALSANAATQGTQPGCATIVRVEGQVEYNLGDGQWHPVVAGKVLSPGSTIRSLYNGRADVVLGREIQFPQAKSNPERIGQASDSQVTGYLDYHPSAEQNAIRLMPDTTISIDKLFITDTGADSVSDTELNLTQGKIFCSVKKLTGASKYLVKIPTGIAGVRGTKFSIDVNGTVYCFESAGGGVVLSYKNALGVMTTASIAPGFFFDAATQVLNAVSGNENVSLQETFAALQTLYLVILDFNEDPTQTFVSPLNGVP